MWKNFSQKAKQKISININTNVHLPKSVSTGLVIQIQFEPTQKENIECKVGYNKISSQQGISIVTLLLEIWLFTTDHKTLRAIFQNWS